MTHDIPLSERFARMSSAIVHDVMRAEGHTDFVLPRELRPLDATRRLAGPAYPVAGEPAAGFDGHESLLRWTELLGRVPRGHVLVLQPNDDEVAHMGELSAETLAFRGVLGCVIDGGCRDVERVVEVGLPVFARYFTPVDVVGRWTTTCFGAAVKIGTVTINEGDQLVCDRDGACVVPHAAAERVAVLAEEAMGKENMVRTAILSGVDPQRAYLDYGKF